MPHEVDGSAAVQTTRLDLGGYNSEQVLGGFVVRGVADVVDFITGTGQVVFEQQHGGFRTAETMQQHHLFGTFSRRGEDRLGKQQVDAKAGGSKNYGSKKTFQVLSSQYECSRIVGAEKTMARAFDQLVNRRQNRVLLSLS